MAMSTYLRDKLLNHALCGTVYTAPATKYLALMTTAPTDAGGGVEISTTGTGYARKSGTFALTAGTASTASKASLTAAVEFAAATSNWGTITHVAVYDALTGGNLLFWSPIDVPKNIGSGDVYREGSLSIDLI